MYINAVADSVMLHLQHEFYNLIFKIKHKLYIASGCPRPSLCERKILGAHLFPVPHYCIISTLPSFASAAQTVWWMFQKSAVKLL
jgi:hypothetical protein